MPAEPGSACPRTATQPGSGTGNRFWQLIDEENYERSTKGHFSTMKTWVRKSLNVGVLSAGFLLVSGGAAHADWTTGYNAGLLDGNQLDTKLQVPVDVSGNALGL